jgi:hypothetical protein
LGALIGVMQISVLHIVHILHIYHKNILHIFHIQEFDGLARPILPVITAHSSVLLLPLVQMCNTWTIQYEMRRESADFPGASCDKRRRGRM